MIDRSKLAILAICAFALAAALAGWTYHRGRAARPLAFWGADAGVLIGTAPGVTALLLRPATSRESGASEVIEVGGARWAIVEERQAAGTNGITNVRRALLDDGSFDWNAPLDACRPEWTHALRFSNGAAQAVVLLSFDCPRATLAGGDIAVSTQPSAPALRAYFEDAFTAAAPSGSNEE